MKQEFWTSIPGYEGFYEVSDMGNVRRIARASGATPMRKLALGVASNGYLHATLCVDSKRNYQRVHRLVMLAFHGPRDRSIDVNHKNGNKADNRLENLEYVTRSQNISHAIATGRVKLGEERSGTKLTADAVRQMRARYAAGESGPKIAKDYPSLSYMTVWNAIRRSTWKHVQ